MLLKSSPESGKTRHKHMTRVYNFIEVQMCRDRQVKEASGYVGGEGMKMRIMRRRCLLGICVGTF